RLAVHLHERQGQVRQRRVGKAGPIAVEAVSQREVAPAGGRQRLQQDRLAVVVAVGGGRDLPREVGERLLEGVVGQLVAGRTGKAQGPDGARRRVAIARLLVGRAASAGPAPAAVVGLRRNQ